MPKGYVIVHAEVTNPEKWAEYVAKSKVALDKFGGKPIVRGGKAEIVEGDGLRAQRRARVRQLREGARLCHLGRVRRGQEAAPGRRHTPHGRRRGRLIAHDCHPGEATA